ncbi:MAG: hypothetical protein AB1778_09340 [Candidatus Bipolaricaulota bacterium]
MRWLDGFGVRVRRIAGIAVAFAVVVVAGVGGWAQDAILAFRVADAPVTVSPGRRAEFVVRVENVSLFDADDVEFEGLRDAVGLSVLPAGVSLVRPFETAAVTLAVVAEAEVEEGDVIGGLDVVYTYCIGDLCYQIVDRVDLPLRVSVLPERTSEIREPTSEAVPAQATSTPGARPFPWAWGGFAVLGGALVAAALVSRRFPRAAVTMAVAVCSCALAWGILTGGHRQAQAIGAVLCTSCVGIETAGGHEPDPELNDRQRQALAGLSSPIELLVFYAPWCHACPYAERVADLFASLSPWLSIRHVNAEQESGLAETYGVARGGRIVVPAVVRVDRGDVVFGVDRLIERLLDLLGVGS